MTTKTDQILNHVIELKTGMGEVKQHLKDLNGSVKRHETNIEDLYTKTGKNKTTLDKIWGGIAVIGLVAGAVGTFLIDLVSKIWK